MVLLLCLTWLFGEDQAWFLERAQSLGLSFTHQDGGNGAYYYVETTGAGACWLDYDGDGDLDLLLLNGGKTPGSPLKEDPANALFAYENGRFHEVTQQAGLVHGGISFGACAGDVDGDGLIDLFITQYAGNLLYRNLGGGRFEEVARARGVTGGAWGTSCAMGDVDGDGDLDLYVANYVAFSFEKNRSCGDKLANLISYCRPDVYAGLDDTLWINDGRGFFSEEAVKRGIDQNGEVKSFGVVLSDIDEDRDLDILVAADGTINGFYPNQGKGRFSDDSLMSSLGYNGSGEAEGGMGITVGDMDGDGRLDVFVTNYARESNTLYRNLGDGLFEDRTAAAGLALPSYRQVGWGTRFFDYDNDGDLDLAVANGHVLDNIALIEDGGGHAQPDQLFANDGKGVFSDVSTLAGSAFTQPTTSRSLAVADFDSDGRLDLLITQDGGPVRLLHNRHPNDHHWLGLQLSAAGNAPAIGARVVVQAGARQYKREVRAGDSFLSCSDPRLHVGLGDFQGTVKVTIFWPNGREEQRTFADLNRYHRLFMPRDETPR